MSITSTKQRILNAANQLVKESGFEHLSVQAIAERSGISRKTFYNHFEDKYALFLWSYEQEIMGCLGKISPEYPYAHALRDMLRFIRQSSIAVPQLARSDLHRDSIYIAMRNSFLNLLSQHKQQLDDTLIFQIDFYFKASVDAVNLWIKHGFDCNADNLAKKLLTCMPQPLGETLQDLHVLN